MLGTSALDASRLRSARKLCRGQPVAGRGGKAPAWFEADFESLHSSFRNSSTECAVFESIAHGTGDVRERLERLVRLSASNKLFGVGGGTWWKSASGEAGRFQVGEMAIWDHFAGPNSTLLPPHCTPSLNPATLGLSL